MQTLKEINKTIERKITSKEISTIYAAIAHNPHLSFDMAVKLGAKGITQKCDTYSGWNSQNVHIKRGEHSNIKIPLRTAYGEEFTRYFTAEQTNVKTSNTRTIQSLFNHINGYAFMQIYAEKIDFSAICAAIKNYAEENNVIFNRTDEPYIINGIASILVNTCGDVDKIEVDSQPYPDRDYLVNAKLLKEIGSHAANLLDLIEISEAKEKSQTKAKSSETAKPSATSSESGEQIDLFETQSEPTAQLVTEPEPVVKPAITPFYQKYVDKEAANPDTVVVMHVGDFYEVMGENAKAVSEKLDLTLTGRNVGLPDRVPMCGFPYHVAETYFERILERVSPRLLVIDSDIASTEEQLLERPAAVNVLTLEQEALNELERYEAGRRKAQENVQANGEPYVTIEWSENPSFNGGDVLPLYEADNLFEKLDKEYSDLGYDKVKFHIDFIKNGKLDFYGAGRYDIGDRDDGLIKHIDNFISYYKNRPNDTFSKEEVEEVLDLCTYFRLHKALSEILETFDGSSEEIRTVFNYVKETRAALNATERAATFVLPEPPELLKSNTILKEFITDGEEAETLEPETLASAVGVSAVPVEQLDETDADIAAEEERLTFGGQKTRFKDNLEAIKTYKRLLETGAAATPEEKAVMKKYVGWGGIKDLFDLRKDSWEKERNELKRYLTPAEYNSAESTVTDAFYTPFNVVKGMYAALQRFGVKGNNLILEPSMGIGNFLRVMPSEIKQGSEISGVEIDSVTGGMAKLIYPDADITVKGFEKTLFRNGSFDVVIGNVPFGSSKPVDIQYDYNFELHDFMIAKSLDKVRAGGIVALITSSSTMDTYRPTARQYMADRAELVGAIRLPVDTFKSNANTSVVTDIIFLKKRDELIQSNDGWIYGNHSRMPDGNVIYLNDYFAKHPEMIIGEMQKQTNRWGVSNYLPVLADGENLSNKLSEKIALLPENIFTAIEREKPEEELNRIPADESVRNYCYEIKDGQLYQRQGDYMSVISVPERPKNALERISGMIALRKEVRKVLALQRRNCSDAELSAAQSSLNAVYDEFVKKFGLLHSSINKNLFSNDADASLLMSLEIYNKETKETRKADVFTKRSISPVNKVLHVDNTFDALQTCKNERGVVDIKYIEQLTGKDFDTVIEDLSGYVFKNPRYASNFDKYRGYESSELYLSGDVKTKLTEARNAAEKDSSYISNIKALEEVQPAFIPAEDIIVSLGAPWIDENIYEDFIAKHILKITGYSEGVQVRYDEITNSYNVRANLYAAENSEANKSTFGTSDIGAIDLFRQALNLKSPNIYDKAYDSAGKETRKLNLEKTALAREKQTKLKTEFAQWIFSDSERREYLTNKYNEKYNRHRLPQYDGSCMTFPGMNSEITLNKHQKDAIYRGMAEGTLLLHHCVGAGKTYEMDAMIMKLRQSGLAKKPMQVVPKATLEQAEAEFRKLYPDANLLVASAEDFSKDNLTNFIAKIALGDWDCVILTGEQFNKINVSPERQAKKLAEEISKIKETIEAARKDGDRNISIRRLQTIVKNKTAELEKLMQQTGDENAIRFEDLGVDYLFVDEAHLYKNKFFFTKMSNVAGISMAASQRASSMDLKIDYINELHGGDKGVVFATGTPISNTMSEMYTMQSYLQKTRLRELNLDMFDNWAATFGEIIKSYEIKPSGDGYQNRERFASFVNVPELMTMYGLFADIKMLRDLNLPVPTAKYEKVIAPKTPEVAELMLGIAARAEAIHSGEVDPDEDNMLKITSDGKKIALDVRLYDPTLPEPDGGKLQLCAENVAEIYHSTAENKSTQIIFCDSSTPKPGMSFESYNSSENFNVYYEIKKKLVELGVAADEIAFIHDYSDKEKNQLREDMNTGKIRVLMGSTSKCGTGLNVQNKLIAGHHLDIPYRPSDMEQREGRIIRQGNENSEVTIYTYAQEGTFDVYLFQILETKQKFIKQLLEFKIGSRKIEDIADNSALSYSEMKAAISGNPHIIELEQLRQKEDNLKLLETEYKRNLFRLQRKIDVEYPNDIKRANENIESIANDVALNDSHKTEEFTIKINSITYIGKTEEAGAAFMSAYNAATAGGEPFAEINGFDVSKDSIVILSERPKLILEGAAKYRIAIGESGVGALMRISNVLDSLPEKLEKEKAFLKQSELNLSEAQSEILKPFERADELLATVSRIDELKTMLQISDVATDDIILDSDKPVQKPTVDDAIYHRIPLQYLAKEEVYKEIAHRFKKDYLNYVLETRKKEPEERYDVSIGVDYNSILSYSNDDLKAALENYHSYVTKQGFEVFDLLSDRGRIDAVIRRESTNDYVLGLGYNKYTGEWAQGLYNFKTLADVYNKFSELTDKEIDYRAVVTKIVEQEYINSPYSQEDDDTYEGQGFEMLRDFFVEQRANNLEYLDENQYKALYECHLTGHSILEDLLDEFDNHFEGGLATPEDITRLIEQYNYTYYPNIVITRNEVDMKPEDIKDNDDNAYFYEPNTLSDETWTKINVEAAKYVIAAPSSSMTKEEMDNRGVSYLQIGKDISLTALSDINNEAEAREAMQVAWETSENATAKAEFLYAWNNSPDADRKAVMEELSHAERMGFINDETNAKQRLEWIRELRNEVRELAIEAGTIVTFANRRTLASWDLNSLKAHKEKRLAGQSPDSDLSMYSIKDIDATIEHYDLFKSREAEDLHKWMIQKTSFTGDDKHSMSATSSTTLGEDLATKAAWETVVLPNSAMAMKGDKNSKIIFPEGAEHSGAEFWVSNKFIKNATVKDFKLILPHNYTVRLKTPTGELSLPAKTVIQELKDNVIKYPTSDRTTKKPEIKIDAASADIDVSKLDELNMSDVRKDLVQKVVQAMSSGDIEWLRTWATTLPRNAISGREYNGINNIILSAIAAEKGYNDNRWLTFNQITSNNWKLKKGSKAVKIELIKLYDKETKKDFDESVLEGMTEEESKEYFDKNVKKVMRAYSVFNASCVEGIPEEKLNVISDDVRHAACEKIIANSPAKIHFDGGNEAYYSPGSDSIHLPKRERFYSSDDFYHVALHEIGHSTGHSTRLNRDLTGMQGTEKYAKEELCAELGSLFISQKLGIKISDKQLLSSAAYLKGWASVIKNDPKYLFKAISEAGKIEKYVTELQNGTAAGQNFADSRMKMENLQRGGKKPVVQSSFANAAERNKPNASVSKSNTIKNTNTLEQ